MYRFTYIPPWHRYSRSLDKGKSKILRYQIDGSISKSIDFRDLLFLIYHVGASQRWLGNTTRNLEIKTYGKQPGISRRGSIVSLELEYGDLVDINRGKFYRWEWNNNQNSESDFGVLCYKAAEDESWLIMIMNISMYIAIAIIITLYLIIRKNRRKIEPNSLSSL